MIEPQDKKALLKILYDLLDLRYRFDNPLQKAVGDCYIVLRNALDTLESQEEECE